MASRTLHAKAQDTAADDVSDAVSDDVSDAVQETQAPEAFIPNQPDAPSADTAPETDAAPPTGTATPTDTAPPTDAAAKSPAEEAPALSERDRAVLAFEKQYWKYSGAKEQAIRDRFGLSATRYYQVLNGLLDRPEAQEFEPVLIKRLRRRRAARQRARSAH